mgnify:CR=1 FL=1
MEQLFTYSQKKIVILFLGFILLLSLTITISLYANAPNETAGINEGPNCRYGVATFHETDNPYIDQLNAGWAVNFKGDAIRNLPSDVEYVPIIRITQKRVNGNRVDDYTLWSPNSFPALGNLIDANPGKLWLVGNEIDRHTAQDDIMPDVYAKAYHEIYEFIKGRDPSAQVAISALVQVTPGRLQYLDIVWDSYLAKYGTPMPVDVWNFHVYVLPERRIDGTDSAAAVALGTDPSLAKLESFIPPNGPFLDCARDDVYCVAEHDDMTIFVEQIIAMRQWMKDHGQQHKPLILSEFSTLYPYSQEGDSDPNTCFTKDENGNCFTPARVNQFMNSTFAYLENTKIASLGYPYDDNKLVQQWLWFAMNQNYIDPIYPPNEISSNKLVDYALNTTMPTNLTAMGNNFRNHVTNIPAQINLVPLNASNKVVFGTTSTPISVDILNNGNTTNKTHYNVTFYSDASLSLGSSIGTAVITEDLLGCARPTQKAEVTWNGLTPGIHQFWAKVDNNNNVGESNESDNVISGYVFVDPPEQVYLPTIQR